MTAPTAAGRYDPDDPSLRYGASLRHTALTAAAAGIRVRRGRVPVEQVLLVAAVVLFPLGLVLILLGWYGAAHTGRLYAQIDYLISGGMLGVGISVAGGFMYFGYWLSRQLSESRRQNALTVQSLQRIEDLLEANLADHRSPAPAQFAPAVPAARSTGGRPAVRASVSQAAARGRPRSRPGRAEPVPTPVAAPPAAAATDPTDQIPVLPGPVLVATPRGSLLHLPHCAVVAKRTDLRPVPPGTEGFGYCSMCGAAESI